MKKYLVALHIALVLMLLIALPVLAYSYSTDIEVQETNGTSYAPMTITAEVDNSELADANFIKDTALDTRILWGSTEMPWMVAEDRVNFFSYATYGDSTDHFSYTFGNSDASYMPVVTGYDGYVTVPDDADLELGDDFEIEIDGYIDTSSGSDKNLVYKQNAFTVYVSAEGEITVGMIGAGVPADVNLLPNGEGAYTECNLVAGTTNWEAMDDPVASPDDDTTCISGDSAAPKDAYNLENGSFSIYDTINSVTVHYRGRRYQAGYNASAQPGLRLDSTDVWGTAITFPADVTYHNYSEVISRPGGGAWVFSDIASLQSLIKVSSASSYGRTTQEYVKINYSVGVTATVTGVSSGEHDVKVYADGSYLMISLGGDTSWDGTHSARTALGGASVPDNANDWIINQNNVLPYFDYYKHTVSDTLIAWYQPVTMIENTGASGEADSGSTTTLVDADLTQVDDYWNLARLIITETTDNLAPEGEVAVVTDFSAGSDELTFDALTAAIGAGDSYTVDFGTLPDRQGAAEDGVITWGYNPDGIDVTIGSAIPSGQIMPGTSQETDPEDIIAPGGNIDTSSYDVPADGTVARSVYDMLDMWIDAFTFDVPVMVFINVVWAVISLGLMIWLAIKIPDHRLIAFIAGGCMLGIGVGLSFLPWWVMAVYVPLGIGLLAMERKPVL